MVIHRRSSGLLAATITLLWGLHPSLGSANTFTVFGNTYVRQTGAPVTVTDTFLVFNPAAPYTLHVQNLGVASALISVNGVQVLGPSDFDPNITSIDRPVNLAQGNQIAVELRSKPGSSLVISIIGIDNDPPVIVATASPSPNSSGWNHSNVVVTFACSDATSGVASCPSPVTVSTEGSNQVVGGTAVDRAGNTASAGITLKIDLTPPVLTITSPPNGFTSTTPMATLSGNATDALSGIATTSCNGAPATLQGAAFTCSVTLNAGANTIAVSATDVAGNSTAKSISVTFGNSTAPAAPTGLAASSTVGEVLLTWTGSPGAAGYKAKRATNTGGPYTMVGITTANTFVDTEVVGGTAYYYVVTAINRVGESPNSNEASQTAPGGGGGVTIQNATGGTVAIADPNNPNSIVTIVIPPGVLGIASDTISVSFSDTAPGPLNANAAAAGSHFVSRVISLSRASGLKFTLPITVTIPYDLSQVGAADSLLVLYWDTLQNAYDVADPVGLDRTKGTITFQTVHFSQYRAVDVPLSLPPITTTIPSPEEALDTGFRAATDGFSIGNISSMTGSADQGACFGLTAFAKWFYETQVPIQADRLATNKIFNNQGNAVEDDVARELIYWSNDTSLKININLAWLNEHSESDVNTANNIFTSIFVTGHPQLVELAISGTYQAPKETHSVLVYSYEIDSASGVVHFSFYDPNVPGLEQLLNYNISTNSFSSPAYTDVFGDTFLYVYFNGVTTFLAPSDFVSALDDSYNGWPDAKRHFNEISIDLAKSTGLTQVSADGPDPVSNPAVFEVLPGATRFAMNWTCSCVPSSYSQVFAHVFLNGTWRTDIVIPPLPTIAFRPHLFLTCRRMPAETPEPAQR